MTFQQFKYRVKRLKNMAPKEIMFVVLCFSAAIVLAILLANGIL